MPPVNWDAFTSLPGSAESNFELLCRALIRRHYGQYGNFAARAAQPGVEFHLKLHAACSLGDAGRWYGWQCRWYDLPSGSALGSARRDKIKQALETTAREVPGITDWVLWTRRPLTKGDQNWFSGLATSFRLHQWTAAEVEAHLCGEAELLRGTYFGELVLTPDTLAQRHTESVAPIRVRWQPAVHRPVAAERALRAMLGETGRWEDLVYLASQLRSNSKALARMADVPAPFTGAVQAMVDLVSTVAAALVNVHGAIGKGDLDHLRQETATPPPPLTRELVELPRKLRGIGHFAALFVTNAVADIRHACELFQGVERSFGVRLVALVADAGCGKTELSAQLTAADKDRPAGVLLHGRDLHAGQTLDALAERFVLSGKPVPSMEALLAAVEAAGQRAKRRLPFLIDGLNESEDPRDWKALLASLGAALNRYPHVLVVCTVRGAFADETLPPEIDRLEIPDFGQDTVGAIRGYFGFYRIDAADADLPLELLKHPLTLRLFCEVTNPARAKVVGIEAMPGSLTSLFDRYLEQASKRITELAPRTRRYFEQDVRTALDQIGIALWDDAARGLDVGALRRALNDEGRPWDQSLVRALEQDGILLRIPGEGGASQVAPVFDALGGHLIADAILARQGQTGFGPWLREAKTIDSLAGPLGARHPLASDVVYALVGLCPRRLHGRQLWQLVDEPLRGAALRLAAELESSYLDAATVESLAVLLGTRPSRGSRDMLERLWQTRGASAHPLNSEFLDRTLRAMPIADRDLRWTEWVRRRSLEITDDLKWIAERWRKEVRRPGDDLRARWVMWTLTSTVRELRDQATKTLYWFGRLAPSQLFDLTIDSLEINDPYVSERMLAASYGVAMAHQQPTTECEAALAGYLLKLANCVVGAAATNPTGHWLARTYARGTFEFAKARYPAALPRGVGTGRLHFASGAAVEPLSDGDSRADEAGRTLHMDFENYTLGSLFDNRANYDMKHSGHRGAVAHVRGVVWSMGWREVSFGPIDKELSDSSYSGRTDRSRAERYGKKYGWIGFHTYAGLLEDADRLPRDSRRMSAVDIDPSFPEPITPDPCVALQWLSPEVADDRAWIERGRIDVPDVLFRRVQLGSHEGPWIAVQGYLQHTDKVLGRQVFAFLSGVAVGPEHAQGIRGQLEAPGHCGGRVPEVPSDYYTFAGEIPWSEEFGTGDRDGDVASLYRKHLRIDRVLGTEIEIFAHQYAWESYHSALNRAGGALVPSKLFSAAFELRGGPQTFDQARPDSSTATITVGAPSGFNGEVLYLREDLLQRYLAGRVLVWFLWGERQLYPFPHVAPEWLNDARRNGLDTWRLVRTADELSPALRVRNSPNVGRGRSDGQQRTRRKARPTSRSPRRGGGAH